MVRLGPRTRGIANQEVTWRKGKNTVSDRMKDGSLVHLYTNKKINRRTKILNSQLQKIPYAKLSYAEYIKAKTVILRILSEDELTDDEEAVSADSSESPKDSVDVLMKEMALESPDSDEESEPPRRVRNRSLAKESSRKRYRASHREEPLNASESDGSFDSPTVIKRPMRRSRKVRNQVPLSATDCTESSLTSAETKLNFEDTVQCTSARNEIVNNDEEALMEKENVTTQTREKDPSDVEKKQDSNDDISEKSHANILIDEDQVRNSTDEKYGIGDEEFRTPNTSDCEDADDEKLNSTHVVQYNDSAENFLKNDDMFEEEKVITHPTYGTEHWEGQCKNNIDNTGEQDSSKTIDQSQNDQDAIAEASFVEENKKDLLKDLNIQNDTSKSDIFSDTDELEEGKNTKSGENPSEDKHKTEAVDNIVKGDPFAPQLDAESKGNVNNIQNDINEAVNECNEKFVKHSNSLNQQQVDSPGKPAVVTKKSRKTPGDIKRNLLMTLDSLPDKCLLNEQRDTYNQPIPNADSGNSNSDDQSNCIVTGDSGIDEDSEDVLFQDFLKHKEAESDDASKISHSPKKKLNLKIKCTEVVKSKYMIVRDVTNSEISDSPPLSRRSPQNAPERPQEEQSEDIPLRGEESENEEKRFDGVSLRTQLNEFSFDEDEWDDDHSEVNRQRTGFIDDSNYPKTDTSKNVRPLSAPNHSESLKYVLNALHARQKYMTDWYQEEVRPFEPEPEMLTETTQSDGEGESEKAHESDGMIPMPTSIPEFIEGTDLLPLELPASFTLADLGDDDDIYVMEIPKSILEQNLKGKNLKIRKRKMIIGEDRYDVQQTAGEPTSLILQSGNGKGRYKTGVIKPMKRLVVKYQVKDDLVQEPKLEPETNERVPFPTNVKIRNPLIWLNNASPKINGVSPDRTKQNIHEKLVKSKKRKRDSPVPACVSEQLDTSNTLKQSKKPRKL